MLRPERAPDYRREVAGERVEIERLGAEHLAPAERQQLLRDGGRPPRRPIHLGQVVARRMVLRHFPKRERGEADHRLQRVVDLVRDPAGQPAHRIHALRGVELFLDAAQLREVEHEEDAATVGEERTTGERGEP